MATFKSSNKHVYTPQDFNFADVLCPVGEFKEIGRFTCTVGQVMGMGYGANLGQQNSLGRIYFDPKITGAVAVEGEIRIMRYDSNDMPTGLVFAGHTSELRATLADRTTWRVFEDKNRQIKEDSQYRIFFKNMETADKTLTKADSKFYIDGMRYML